MLSLRAGRSTDSTSSFQCDYFDRSVSVSFDRLLNSLEYRYEISTYGATRGVPNLAKCHQSPCGRTLGASIMVVDLRSVMHDLSRVSMI